jgi:hypothetical protein
MRKVIPIVTLVAITSMLAGATAAQLSCTGDCNADGTVSINELIRGVNIALGNVEPSECDSFDDNGDGQVSINELVRAVSNALTDCVIPDLPLLEGSTAVMAAARVALSTADAIQIMDLGFAGTSAGASAGMSERRLRLARVPFAASRRAVGPVGRGVVVTRCGRGGTAGISCTVTGGTSTRTVMYSQCRELADDGTFFTRDGELTETVGSSEYCGTLEIPPTAAVTVALRNFIQTSTTAGEALLTRRTATIQDAFVPGEAGCAGLDGTDTFTGTLRFECNPAADPDCAPDMTDVTLRAMMFTTTRTSSGSPCKVRVGLGGRLDIDNATTGDRFLQTFAGPAAGGLTLTETALEGGDSLLQEDGRTSVQCLGEIEFQTDEERAIRFAAGSECPGAGELRVALPAAGEATPMRPTAARSATDPASNAPGTGRAAAVSENGGVREFGFRAANGQVYQVLQNPAGNPELGTEDVRLTSLIGSADAVARCDAAAGSAFPAQAIVAAAAGQAFALEDVVKSPIIADASRPCFNGNAVGGDGSVCVGAGCTADCRCPGGGCATFSIATGTPLGQGGGVPPATLVAGLGEIGDPCSGFVGLQTYAFGATQPSTEAALCSAVPADGVTLRGSGSGQTLILAYAAPFAVGFNIGSAGFAVDADGSNPVQSCGAPNRVITGLSNRTQLAPPLVRFGDAQGVEFDFNADEVIDRAVSRCGDLAVAPCQRLTPTPTPTSGIDPPCPGRDLPMLDVITRREGTLNQPNLLGGATCGDGGNTGAERSYRYRAPSDGFYTIDTVETEGVDEPFDTLLYVRRSGDCNGAELACNDNAAAGVLQSQVGLTLRAGEEIAIIVDGAGGARGNFQLRIGRSEQSPTPTATRTPTMRSDLPDLVVAVLTAPTEAMAGQFIDVAATVRNESANPAGEFEVAFVFATDQGLSQGVVDSGFSCTIAGLAPGANDGCALRIRVPPSLTNGTYFLGAIADAAGAVDEADEGNNARAADSGPLAVGGGTPGPTDTPEPTQTANRTDTPISTVTAPPASATASASRTATGTAISTTTAGASRTATTTPTISTATLTPPTATEPPDTATPVAATSTPSHTDTATASATPAPPTSTESTETLTPTPVATATRTRTVTGTPSATPTATAGMSGTSTPPVEPLGTPFRVNSDTGGSQLSGAVAASADGAFVVVWSSPDGASSGIFGQRYSSSGAPAGGEFQVNTTISGNQRLPAVAKAETGEFTALWTSDGQDGDGGGIYAQRFTSSGAPSGFEFQVNSYTPGAQYGPQAIIAGVDKTLTAVWNGFDAADRGVVGRRFNGATGGPEFVLSTPETGLQDSPVLAADQAGNFVGAWADLGADGDQRGIFGQRFASDGSTLGDRFQVNSYTVASQSNPAIAVATDGTILVVWQAESGQDGAALGIFAQHYASSGAPLSSEFQVNTYTRSTQENPDVAAIGDRDFVVVWESLQDGSDRGIFGQVFSSVGAPLGTEFRVNTVTSLAQISPRVAAGADGEFVVVWENESSAGNFDIFGRRYRRR